MLVRWMLKSLGPVSVTSDLMVYENQESQSGRSLPVVYKPFDPMSRSHWEDRGTILDFLVSTNGGSVLDFGPGDGWPSLLLAPFVTSVVGIDGSSRRVRTCRDNAARLGIANAEFQHVYPGSPLPFEDCSFDSIVAASSLEQAPNPQAVLREFYRVLKPGGKLRISYESLVGYAGGREEEVWVWSSGVGSTMLVACERDLAHEKAVYCGLKISSGLSRVLEVLGSSERLFRPTTETITRLQSLLSEAAPCTTMTLRHPGAQTLRTLLRDEGFETVISTHSGGFFARSLYDSMPVERRPSTMSDVDRLLEPGVRVAVTLEAPVHLNGPITAVK